MRTEASDSIIFARSGSILSTQTSKPLCGQDFELTDLMRPTVTDALRIRSCGSWAVGDWSARCDGGAFCSICDGAVAADIGISKGAAVERLLYWADEVVTLVLE